MTDLTFYHTKHSKTFTKYSTPKSTFKSAFKDTYCYIKLKISLTKNKRIDEKMPIFSTNPLLS
jgi:hypothetical protein